MKKCISTLLALAIALSSLMVSFTAFASESQESNAISGFIDGITELVQAYDTDKEFTVPENDESKQIQSFSAENTVDETDNHAAQEYTLQDFQTARLIVRANGNFNPSYHFTARRYKKLMMVLSVNVQDWKRCIFRNAQ